MAINLALTLTLDGRDAFWNSGNTGTKLDITHLQFGTRNRLPTGEESLLSLPKQSVKIQNGNKIGPDQVRIMATMPGIENYNVTEIGLWSGEPGLVGSILIAYTSVRTGYIAQMVNGIDLVFTYDMVIATTDIDKINIVKDTDQSSTFSLLAEHETDRNAHPFYVTTDTAQTISGAKTFTNKAIFSGGLTGELTGNASTATQLKTPRTIGGVSFNGTANINLPGVDIAGNQNTSGNAATASKLAAAVLIGGVAFDGSAAINLPGVDIAGNQNTSGNAATATKLQTARTINGVSFDGSANITIADNTKLPLAGGTITGSLNVSDTITVTNVGEQVDAFKKLIQASTTTDGGYIAVGNHGSDKGYLELGTTDDADAAIYARKRNAANTVLEEAVILGSDGNTSFPHSVFIHNTPGGYTKNGLVKGNADNAAYTGCNIDITSWFGVGIKASNSGERTVVFNARTGDISNRGSLHTEQWVNAKALGVNNTEGTGAGLSLHGGTAGGMPSYGISFAQTYHYGTHGYVSGDWATYFTMTGGNNRGWIFRHADLGNVASINAQGLLSIPTMKMDRSNFQVVTGSNYTVTYDYATRIVRIVMKVMSAVGVGHSTSPFKVVEGRWTATFTLPITLQVRLSAEFAFQQVGLPGYRLWDAEAGEWHAWCAPPGHRGSTESAVTVDVVRWRGGDGEPVDGYLTVVGFF